MKIKSTYAGFVICLPLSSLTAYVGGLCGVDDFGLQMWCGVVSAFSGIGMILCAIDIFTQDISL